MTDPVLSDPVLAVSNLTTSFRVDGRWQSVVRSLSFAIGPRETVAVVGESGAGKSVTALSIMRLTPPGSSRIEGSVRLGGRELLDLPDAAMCKVRGGEIAMIFQEPMTSLNPVLTIGFQIAETLILHRGLSRAEAEAETVRLLDKVRIPAARSRLHDYPHRFSGGMRQRVMIAMALACRPKLLIADEPTTALDVTIQAQIMDLLVKLQKERGMALVLISHDLAVVSEVAQRVAVMYAGEVIETNRVPDIFRAPHHPYTEALLAAIPEHNQGARRLAALPGMVPGRDDRPSGCLFAPRCKYVVDDCRKARPALDTLVPANDAMRARCIKPLNVSNLDLTGGAR